MVILLELGPWDFDKFEVDNKKECHNFCHCLITEIFAKLKFHSTFLWRTLISLDVFFDYFYFINPKNRLPYFDIISKYRLHKSVSFPFNVTGSTQLRALGWEGQLSAEYKCRELSQVQMYVRL